MKISIITAVFNNIKSIGCALESVNSQKYKDVEHILIDGFSTDGTIDYLKSHLYSHNILISEPDKGIYDALNKGLRCSTGDVIGILHSDDFFLDDLVLSKIANIFLDNSIDIVYADLDYVSNFNDRNIIRRWRAGAFQKNHLKYGWMPPHPTVFIRRNVFNIVGFYDNSYSISADYDFLLRVFSSEKFKVFYLPNVLVQMRMGGKSNNTLSNLILKSYEDYRVIRVNKVGGFLTLMLKNLRKIPQFFN
jgi:glycosyltransferase